MSKTSALGIIQENKDKSWIKIIESLWPESTWRLWLIFSQIPRFLPLAEWTTSGVHSLKSWVYWHPFCSVPTSWDGKKKKEKQKKKQNKKNNVHHYNCRMGKSGAERTYYHLLDIIASASFCRWSCLSARLDSSMCCKITSSSHLDITLLPLPSQAEGRRILCLS